MVLGEWNRSLLVEITKPIGFLVDITWYNDLVWLAVWNMAFMTFHSVGNNHSNWQAHIFPRGRAQPPTSRAQRPEWVHHLWETQRGTSCGQVSLCTDTNVRPHADMHVDTHTQIYIYIYLYMYMYIFLCIYICTSIDGRFACATPRDRLTIPSHCRRQLRSSAQSCARCPVDCRISWSNWGTWTWKATRRRGAVIKHPKDPKGDENTTWNRDEKSWTVKPEMMENTMEDMEDMSNFTSWVCEPWKRLWKIWWHQRTMDVCWWFSGCINRYVLFINPMKSSILYNYILYITISLW